LADIWAVENSRDALFASLKRREVFGTSGSNVSPRFIALAPRDPERSPLRRLQIIKGWIDAEDKAHFKVFDIAGDAGSTGTIGLETGVWSGRGRNFLCTVLQDPEFDSNQPGYYCMRAVEAPSLRWNCRQCVDLPASNRPQECKNDAPTITQELAGRRQFGIYQKGSRLHLVAAPVRAMVFANTNKRGSPLAPMPAIERLLKRPQKRLFGFLT
jgi:hypothetical protein